MKLDKKQFKKILDNEEDSYNIKELKILNLKEFLYFHNKCEEEILKLKEYPLKDNKEKHIKHLRQELLYEFEKNRFQVIKRRDLIMLVAVVKFHNMLDKEHKIYMNEKGHRVKYDELTE